MNTEYQHAAKEITAIKETLPTLLDSLLPLKSILQNRSRLSEQVSAVSVYSLRFCVRTSQRSRLV